MEQLRCIAAIAVGALLIPAAAAQGATKDMFAGTPPKGLLKGVPQFATDNAFYPKRVTIHKGDIRELPDRRVPQRLPSEEGRRRSPALFVLDPSNPVAGVKDAAGADFWFNGQPSVGINPTARGADRRQDPPDGSEAVGTGLPLAGPPKPLKVKFPKKGTYTVLCSLHTGMKGKVVVKGKKAHIASKKQDRKRIKKQSKAASKLAKKLVAGEGAPTGATVKAGNDKKGVATLAFFPEEDGEGWPAGHLHDVQQVDRGPQRGVRSGGLRG